jgi:hypothetical protein
MVTGLPPYSADTFMEILTTKATIDPTPPLLVRADLPAQVSELVMAAMARDPAARPQTMETLEYELNKCLAGRGVAVAQILGMTTDANVVATLNPGLSMRTLDDGAIVSRPSSSPVGTSRGITHSGQMMTPSDGMFSGPHVATGQSALQVRIASEPSPATSARMASQPAAMSAQSLVELPAYEPPSITRSGLGVFGWLVLAALLFGGVGALLYVALGERGERAPSKLDEADQPAPQVGAAPEVPPGTPAPTTPASPDPARPAGGNIKVVPDEAGEGEEARESHGEELTRGSPAGRQKSPTWPCSPHRPSAAPLCLHRDRHRSSRCPRRCAARRRGPIAGRRGCRSRRGRGCPRRRFRSW